MERELHEDRSFLEAFRRGDNDALKLVYERYAPALGKYVGGGFSTTSDGRSLRIEVEDPVERLDVVQETFAKAFLEKNRLTYDGYRPYGPYLLRICRNLAIDRVRARQRRARVIVADTPLRDEEGSSTQVDVAADVSIEGEDWSTAQRASRRELLGLLGEYLKTLNERERELLRLFYVNETSQREAAESMQLTRNQIRTLVAKLRRSLLEHMMRSGVIKDADPGELLRAVTLLLIIVSSSGGRRWVG